MTKSQLIDCLKGIPDDMPVVMETMDEEGKPYVKEVAALSVQEMGKWVNSWHPIRPGSKLYPMKVLRLH